MICPLLLSSFRALAVNNASTKSLSSLTHLTQINIRHKYTAFTDNQIRERLGLPMKPKMPMVPFFRYMKEIRNSVIAKHSTVSLLELNSIIAKMWHSEDARRKEKFIKEYEMEMVKYWDELGDYKKACTEDDKKKLREKKAEICSEIERRKFIRMQRKKALALGKPKKPSNSFLNFLEKCPDRQPGEKYKSYLKRKAIEFQALSKHERDSFAPTPEELEEYKKRLLAWEGKMIRGGEYDVIRGEIPIYKTTDELKLQRRTNDTD